MLALLIFAAVSPQNRYAAVAGCTQRLCAAMLPKKPSVFSFYHRSLEWDFMIRANHKSRMGMYARSP